MFPGILPHHSHFYPRSPCGERLWPAYLQRQIEFISIHALLAESDHQSQKRHLPAGYFYPRSPCGERPCGNAGINSPITISIHALLAESDEAQDGYKDTVTEFLSTLSLRRATKLISMLNSPHSKISIHALLAESDWISPAGIIMTAYFYPRSPCGERPANQTNLPG